MIIIKTIDIKFLRILKRIPKKTLALILLGIIIVPAKPIETTFYSDACVDLLDFINKVLGF